MTVRVLIVDDEELVRTGLRMILSAEPEIEIVGEAADGADAIHLAGKTAPDVVLMDIRMPRMDGIEATRQLRAATAARVVMLTTFDLDEHVFQALRAGASGFLTKDSPSESLVAAIHAAATGDALLAPSVTRRLIEAHVGRPPPEPLAGTPMADLTARETEVLRLLARGLSNAELARELIVAETTVKTHVVRILDKLGARDRVQAVIAAYEAGLVTPGDGRPAEG